MESSLQIETEIRENKAVLKLKGDMVSDAEEELAKAVNALPEESRDKIILDLAQTQYINSAGIAALISLLNKVTETGGALKLVGLNRHFQKVLETVGLTEYIPIYESLDEALRS
ncbi:MAG: STAS domain-containing protein [Leptospiraceae bacterium]|nr:STAS domain-containing protein [Leptospiraceae bacterium]MDW8306324.1 STAS domain-containing protein [Leptospiraceae bacterium]